VSATAPNARKGSPMGASDAFGVALESRPPAATPSGMELYRALFDQSPLMCFVVNPAGTVLRVNAQGAEELGYRPEELLGQSVLGVFPAEEHAVVLRHVASCLDDHAIPQSWELRKIRKDGSLLWVREFARGMKDEDGRPVVLISCENITERKRAEHQLRQTADQLRALSMHLQSVREEERTRIARELHDELGQRLTGLKMELSWLGSRLSRGGTKKSPDALLERTLAMSDLVDQSMVEIHRLVAELRPAILDQLGLVDALEWLAQDFARRSGIACEFVSALPRTRMDRNWTTAVFRIVQESLTNVARHSGATRARVHLDEAGDELCLVIEDNGRGIAHESTSSPTSFGLQGMKEHTIQLGGDIRIHGRPGQGTTITVRIPRPPVE
jgi:PAS domain S-box-containing protein